MGAALNPHQSRRMEETNTKATGQHHCNKLSAIMPQLKPKINAFLCNASVPHGLHKQPGSKINNSAKFHKITFLSPNSLVNRQMGTPQYATGLTE